MNYDKLSKVIFDMIKEQQIKLGFEKETIRLYYPMSSLAGILGVTVKEPRELDEMLVGFVDTVRDTLGEVRISRTDLRYCILIPPEGSVYVYETSEENTFLVSLIQLMRSHGCTIEDVLKVFHKFSDHVSCLKSDTDEFDYVISFPDGKPDDYRYCIKFDHGHASYHRFTKSDYDDLVH